MGVRDMGTGNMGSLCGGEVGSEGQGQAEQGFARGVPQDSDSLAQGLGCGSGYGGIEAGDRVWSQVERIQAEDVVGYR